MKKIAFVVMLLLALGGVGAYGQSITVTSPNGGEVWPILSNQNITWTSTGVITDVKIEFIAPPTNGSYTTIIASTPNNGSYAWILPKINGSTGGRVKISDVANPDTFDISDAVFTIHTDLNLPDSVWLERIPNAGAPPSSNVNYEIWINNDEVLTSATIPISWSSPNITVDTLSIQWGPDLTPLDLKIKPCDLVNRRCNFNATKFISGQNLPTGYHKFISFNFVTNGSWNPTTGAIVDTTLYPPSSRLKFLDTLTTVAPNGNSNQFIPRYVLQGTVAEVIEIKDGTVPMIFTLGQNYPNPFNPVTVFDLAIPTTTKVKVEVFNLLGQKVKTLLDKELTAGKYQIKWDATNETGESVASGIYFYRLNTDKFTDVKKMILLR
jgi:hypothetical protein